MSENKTRKAVVTLEAVRAAFAAYVATKGRIGIDISSHEFDRGVRGKGFAEYNGSTVIRTWESKEDAHTFYSRWTEVAEEVLTATGYKPAESDAETSEDQEQDQDDKPAVPAQTRRRVRQNA